MGKLRKLGIGFGIFVAALAALGALAIVYNDLDEDRLRNPKMSEAEIRAQALEGVSVQELLDNNSEYTGKIVHLKGSIRQRFHQYGDVYLLNVRVHDQEEGSEDKVMLKHVLKTEPEPFSEIDFYGTVTGIEERSALLTGATLYLVSIDGLSVEITPDSDSNPFN